MSKYREFDRQFKNYFFVILGDDYNFQGSDRFITVQQFIMGERTY